MKQDTIYNLVVKYLRNEAGQDDREKLMQWINESADNKMLFDRIEKIWTSLEYSYNRFSPDENKARRKIQEQIAILQQSKRRTEIRHLLRIAALLVLFLGITAVFYKSVIRDSNKLITYISSDTIREIRLQDGSDVWLNKNSTLKVPHDFSAKDREACLEGEAYFEVSEDKVRPFRVRTGKTVTEVLGTSFNIKSSTNSNVEVVLKSGAVAFYPVWRKKSGVILKPGEKGYYDHEENTFQKSVNSNLSYLSWKTNELIFYNTPLSEVCRILSEYYNRRVYVNVSDTGFSLTGSFSDEPLDDIIEVIELTLDVSVQVNE